MSSTEYCISIHLLPSTHSEVSVACPYQSHYDRDINWYLRKLESVVIKAVQRFGITASRIEVPGEMKCSVHSMCDR